MKTFPFPYFVNSSEALTYERDIRLTKGHDFMIVEDQDAEQAGSPTGHGDLGVDQVSMSNLLLLAQKDKVLEQRIQAALTPFLNVRQLAYGVQLGEYLKSIALLEAADQHRPLYWPPTLLERLAKP